MSLYIDLHEMSESVKALTNLWQKWWEQKLKKAFVLSSASKPSKPN
jgi:hypothetical protein